MDGAPLSAEMEVLLDHLARRPDGWEFLSRAPLENAAVMLEVPPAVIDQARSWLESVEGRARLTWALLDIRRKHREITAREPGRRPRPGLPRNMDPRTLLNELEAYPAGPDFVRRGPPETLAVLFGVHPEVVFAARKLLEDTEHGEVRSR